MDAHAVLSHIVRTVIPERCRTAKDDSVRAFYQRALDKPATTIAECKEALGEWVIKNAADGKLRDVAELKKRKVTAFRRDGAIYIINLIVQGQLWTYVGQTSDAWKRISDGHDRPSYRSMQKKSFLYWLWDQASEIWFCLAVSGSHLVSGPTLNILEQWTAVLFLGLQPQELSSNLPPKILRQIAPTDMQLGAGIREPLAEGFSLRDFPMRGSPFQHSDSQLKRQFFAYKRSLPMPDRAAPFLEGELFDGDFHAHGAQYRFHLGRLQFEIKQSFIDSLKRDTIWIKCELAPVGSIHPDELVKGGTYASSVVWDDPARRLGIRLGGLRKKDDKAVETWIKKGGDTDVWTAKINMLVDWLEGQDLTVDRPRRWYPGAEGSRGKGEFTRHPIDFLMNPGEDELFDDWHVRVDQKQYQSWYGERKV